MTNITFYHKLHNFIRSYSSASYRARWSLQKQEFNITDGAKFLLFSTTTTGWLLSSRRLSKNHLMSPREWPSKYFLTIFVKEPGESDNFKKQEDINDKPVKSCCREFKKPNGGTQPGCGFRSYSYRKSRRKCFIWEHPDSQQYCPDADKHLSQVAGT